MKNTTWTVFLFLAATCGVCVAQSDSPSLADVARHNRQSKKPVHVIDQDDIGRGVISVVGNESAQAQAPAPAADAPGKAVADNGKAGPSASNPQVANLKKQLDSYRTERDGWKASAKRYEDQLANETDDFRRQTDQEALDNDKKNIALYQQKITQTEADLSKAQAAPGSQSSAAQTPPASGSTRAPQQ
jgi:hypothetical protein